MSGIRFKPNYIIQPISPEVKKTIYSFSRRDKIRICCLKRLLPIPEIQIQILFFNGGSPLSTNGKIYDGGSPSASGGQIYDGGNP